MKLVCIGDSFTVGPMVDPEKRWTSLLQKNTATVIVNRGVSGDTTSGMLARLIPDCVDEWPDHVLIAGGANDLICCGNADIVKNNFMAMIHQMFHYEIKPLIALPIPCVPEMIPANWAGVCDFSRLNDAFRDLNRWSEGFSKAFFCGRLDLFTPMMEVLHDDPARARRLYLDGLHLSEEGHELVSGFIRQQLGRVLK